jgi:hypothetical protein
VSAYINVSDTLWDDVFLHQQVNDALSRLLNGKVLRRDDQVWFLWRLIGLRHARETLDGALAGFLVETLDVTFLANSQRRVDKDFVKLQVRFLVDSPRHVTIFRKWRHKTANCHNTAIRKQLCHFSHSTNVLFAICLREAQILVEACANVVAVETV